MGAHILYGLHSVVNLCLHRYVFPLHHQNIEACVCNETHLLINKTWCFTVPFYQSTETWEFPCPVGSLTFAVDSRQVDSSGPCCLCDGTTLIMCEVLAVELVNLNWLWLMSTQQMMLCYPFLFSDRWSSVCLCGVFFTETLIQFACCVGLYVIFIYRLVKSVCVFCTVLRSTSWKLQLRIGLWWYFLRVCHRYLI